jgi:chromosomal replication initiation ATPase DnaA
VKQITLAFGNVPDYSRDSFVVSYSNKSVFEWVDKWPNWTSHCFAIYGPEKCGKTHLAHMWQRKTDAVFVDPENIDMNALEDVKNCIVENVSRCKDENALFHLYNHIVNQGGYMLLTDREPLSHLDYQLPDLVSRLKSVPDIEVFEPDDVLLRTVLMKSFSDRQLRVGLDVVEFLLIRMERSFSSVGHLVKNLDDLSLVEKRNITVPFVKQVMQY